MCKNDINNFDILLKNFKQHITNLKLKNTIQKDYILKTLYFAKRHLTVDEITEELKAKYNVTIAIATVYKVIKLLEDLKIVTCLDILDNAKYYELNLSSHHDHLVCTSCRLIIEFNDEIIENKQIQIATKYDFTLDNHIMTIYGLCNTCQKKNINEAN